MSLFAIGDLHLPGGQDKPMSVFGPQWHGHFFRISESWRDQVGETDTVLIPGDISWAMQLEEARGRPGGHRGASREEGADPGEP